MNKILMNTFREFQKMLYKEYVENGYEDVWKNSGKFGTIAELALIITEVSEAIEEVRNKTIDENKLMEECADIIIRTLNFMSMRGKYADDYILFKHLKNMGRGKLHGRGI